MEEKLTKKHTKNNVITDTRRTSFME